MVVTGITDSSVQAGLLAIPMSRQELQNRKQVAGPLFQVGGNTELHGQLTDTLCQQEGELQNIENIAYQHRAQRGT